MGNMKVLKEEFEQTADQEIVDFGRINQTQMHMLEDICSVPFGLEFEFPVTKVVCGFNFASLLTSTGEVYTWGSNSNGELGLDDDKLFYQTQIDHGRPVQFINYSGTSMKKKLPVVDIEASNCSMIALTDTLEVFVWGQRMGLYPTGLELT